MYNNSDEEISKYLVVNKLKFVRNYLIKYLGSKL